MGARNLEDTKTHFAAVLERQMALAKHLYTGTNYVTNLRTSYERLVGLCVWRYECLDAVIYISDDGKFGFRALKFYNDGIDYRVGSYQESEARALQEAIHLL